MRQGRGDKAGLTAALFAGIVVGFCVGVNAGLTRGVRCPAGQAVFAAGAGTGSFADGAILVLLRSALSCDASSSPGNFSSSLPTMAARMKLIQMGSAVTAPVS